jgi:hypothetical protein
MRNPQDEQALPLVLAANTSLVQQQQEQERKISACQVRVNQATAGWKSARENKERLEFTRDKEGESFNNYAKYLQDSPERNNAALQANLDNLQASFGRAVRALERAQEVEAEKMQAVIDAERELEFQTNNKKLMAQEHQGVRREIDRLTRNA